MLADFVGHVKCKVAGWTQTLVKAIKGLVEPARSSSAAAAGVARDSVRGRVDLIAENALPRQQLIVLRRNVGRPVFVRGERFLLVLLARTSCGWRDALHIVRPATLLRWQANHPDNHVRDIWACDFLQLYDALFRPVFAFLHHQARYAESFGGLT